MRTVAVVLAGGRVAGSATAKPKQLGLLAGRTLIEHCIRAFDAAPAVDEVVIVAAPDIEDEVRSGAAAYRKVTGRHPGRSQQDRLNQAGAQLAARQGGGPRTAKCSSTMRPGRLSTSGRSRTAWRHSMTGRLSASSCHQLTRSSRSLAAPSDAYLPRDLLARCQTPQGFRLTVICRAYELADADPGFAAVPATDDCGVVLRYLPEIPIGVVEGSERNLKINLRRRPYCRACTGRAVRAGRLTGPPQSGNATSGSDWKASRPRIAADRFCPLWAIAGR